MKEKSRSGSVRSRSGPEANRATSRSRAKPVPVPDIKSVSPGNLSVGDTVIIHQEGLPEVSVNYRGTPDQGKTAVVFSLETGQFTVPMTDLRIGSVHESETDGSTLFRIEDEYDALKKKADKARDMADDLHEQAVKKRREVQERGIELTVNKWEDEQYTESFKRTIDDIVQFFESVKNIDNERIDQVVRIPVMEQMKRTMDEFMTELYR